MMIQVHHTFDITWDLESTSSTMLWRGPRLLEMLFCHHEHDIVARVFAGCTGLPNKLELDMVTK